MAAKPIESRIAADGFPSHARFVRKDGDVGLARAEGAWID